MSKPAGVDITEVLGRYKDRHDIAQIADRMGKKYFTLTRILNPNDNYDLRLREIVPFLQATGGDFTLLDHIESLLGRVAVPIENGKTNGRFDVESLIRLSAHFSTALSTLSTAVQTGQLKRKDAAKCFHELMELTQQSMTLARKCQDLMEGDKELGVRAGDVQKGE